MRELSKQELMKTNGGGLGFWLSISAGVVFLIGLIDGFKPQS